MLANKNWNRKNPIKSSSEIGKLKVLIRNKQKKKKMAQITLYIFIFAISAPCIANSSDVNVLNY